MLGTRYGSILHDYYVTAPSDAQNPGTVVFDEERLHSVAATAFAEQLWAFLTQLLWPLKFALFVLLLPSIAILFFVPPSPLVNTILWTLAVASVTPAGVVFVEFVEDFVARVNCDAVVLFVDAIVEHMAEFLVALIALTCPLEEMSLWVKPFLLGCMFASLLVTPGVALLLVVSPDVAYLFESSVWRGVFPLLMFSSTCLLLPTLQEGATWGVALTKEKGAGATMNAKAEVLWFSRCLALILSGVYIYALSTCTRSCGHLYFPTGGANVPTSLTYAVRYFYNAQQYKVFYPVLEPRYMATFAAAGACVSFALLLGLCCIVVGHARQSFCTLGLPPSFVAAVLMPLVLRGGGVCGAVFMAAAGRPDVAVNIGLQGALRLAQGVLPAVVLAAWALGKPVDLRFHPFFLGAFFLAVTVMVRLLPDGSPHRIHGVVLMAVYILVAAASFLS